MTPPIHTKDQAKARARTIRADYAAKSKYISHSAALERVAAEQGYPSWNALSARLSNQPDVPLALGDRVEGFYLKQKFEGVVTAVRSMSGDVAFHITIDFDEPVDVVTFESFSAFRRRVTATVSPGGVSFSKTSDGVPHMVVARAVIDAI